MSDYVIKDVTKVRWPGRLPFRSASTPCGKGYRTHAAAARRIRQITVAYNAKHGRSGGDLRVVERASCRKRKR